MTEENPAYTRPNRNHLKGKEVKLKLHPGVIGPKRGIFLGQGDSGLTLRVEGGGRWVYYHHEVKDIKEA